MTHPSVKVPKVYVVTINGKFTEEHAKQMFEGIEIITDTDEKKTDPGTGPDAGVHVRNRCSGGRAD